MPTYEFQCPKGHEFDRFYKTMSSAPTELPCPECGAVAARQLSGGAGLVFKGSGFYLTDYGKNAHRGEGTKSKDEGSKADASKPDAPKAESAKSESGKAEGAKSESSKSESSKSESAKSEGAKPKAESKESKAEKPKPQSSKPKSE